MGDVHDWVVEKIIHIFFRKQAIDASEIMLLSMGARDIKPLESK